MFDFTERERANTFEYYPRHLTNIYTAHNERPSLDGAWKIKARAGRSAEINCRVFVSEET